MCLPCITGFFATADNNFSTAANARQPNLLQWNKHIENCLYNLEKAEDSLPSDKMLVQWVKLRRIIDEISASFKMEDLGTTTKLNRENEGLISHYDKELSNWRDQTIMEPPSRKYIFQACISQHQMILLNYIQNP